MRTGVREKRTAIERMRYRLAADKKKAVTAICLVGVMALMWGRLLLKKGPENALAGAGAGGTVNVQQEDQELTVSYVELPETLGRNDVITRDFFSPAGWRGFGIGAEVEDMTDRNAREVVSHSGSEAIVAAIRSGLELQATRVVEREQPQAYINYKLVEPGDILKIGSGDGTYECEVAEIEENRVSVRCGEVEVVLKLEGALK